MNTGKIIINQGLSFIAKEQRLTLFDSELHFHPEYELKYVMQSKGMRFVGDRVENFQEGDLVLLGPNISHCWNNDRENSNGDNLRASAFLVKFSEKFLGERFFLLPEMSQIKDLLINAKGGLCFPSINKKDIQIKLEHLLTCEGPLRIISLLDILFELSKAEMRPLLTETFVSESLLLNCHDHSVKRMKKVYEYVMANFRNKIRIQDVAEIANMTTHAFCKYFKKRTSKTFMTFLGELRVFYAKKFLIEIKDLPVSDICYRLGFENLSNFYRRFYSVTKMTPKEFRNHYQNQD